jgi:phosphomannomutase
MEKEGSLLGGEGNGGVILKDSHLGRDSLVGAAIVLNLLAIETIKINELFDALPKYYIHKSSVALKTKNENFENKIKEYFIEDEINESDGLKIIRQNEWIHIRKSNTEPILRIISESKSVARSKELVEIIKNEIK